MIVELTDMWGETEARAELLVGSDAAHVVVTSEHRGEEGFAEVIALVRKALAYLGLCGEMEFMFPPCFMSEESCEAAKAAIEKFPEEDLTITPADVARVHEEAAGQEERIDKNLKRLERVVREEGLKRGLDKEERDRMTLGEAFQRPLEEG